MSRTVTGKLPLLEFPAASVAVQDTVVVPRGKTEPGAGLQIKAGNGSDTSLAVATYVTATPCLLIDSTVILPGRANWGGVVSDACACAAADRTPRGFRATAAHIRSRQTGIPASLKILILMSYF